MAIVTASDVRTALNVPAIVDDGTLSFYIKKTLLFDIRNILGQQLMIDIKENEGDYTSLIDAHTYEYQGKKYDHEGLKLVASYLSYARLVADSSEVLSPFGLVQKKGDDFESSQQNVKSAKYQNYVNYASQLWRDVALYLDRNITAYPLWNNCEKKKLNKGLILKHITV